MLPFYLLGSALLLVSDFALALTPYLSLAFTLLETLLVFPWAFLALRLEKEERRFFQRKQSRRRDILAHIANLLLLLLCLGEKWLILVEAQGEDSAGYIAPYQTYTVVAYVLVNLGLLGRGGRAGRFLAAMAEHPARLMALSFGMTALLGALLLTLPQSLRHLADVSFLDSLFMATSAVCITGLSVVSVPETYTSFGQAVIFSLFQVGGLGIMVLSAAISLLAGRKLQVRSSAVLAEMVDTESLASLRRAILSILGYALVIELLGALCLYFLFQDHPSVGHGPTPGEGASGAGSVFWAALFHSVSAFCSAGFSLFMEGMTPFAGSAGVSFVLMALIFLGGLGFPVIDELSRKALIRLRGRRPKRLSLHARVVLATSGILLLFGAVGFLLLEWGRSMAEHPWYVRILTALFQSTTTRSAGFNTLDIGAMGAPALMMTCLLMFIGASPGSTGGGVKTTTFAALFATFRAELRGQRVPHLFDRALPSMTTRKAIGVAFLSVVIVSLVLFVLLLTESHEPIKIAFEAFSAFSTSGLSTGITSELSSAGKLVVTLTMFIGRIGPLTLALALATKARPMAYALPEERMMIG